MSDSNKPPTGSKGSLREPHMGPSGPGVPGVCEE